MSIVAAALVWLGFLSVALVTVKLIAPAVARRQVARRLRWLQEHGGTWPPVPEPWPDPPEDADMNWTPNYASRWWRETAVTDDGTVYALQSHRPEHYGTPWHHRRFSVVVDGDTVATMTGLSAARHTAEHMERELCA